MSSILAGGAKNSAGKPSKIKGFRRFFIFTGKEKNREIHGFSLANSLQGNASQEKKVQNQIYLNTKRNRLHDVSGLCKFRVSPTNWSIFRI